MTEPMDQAGVINELKRRQGTTTAKRLARKLGVSPQYLSDIYRGRREPGTTILRSLKLRRVISYEPVPPAAQR